MLDNLIDFFRNIGSSVGSVASSSPLGILFSNILNLCFNFLEFIFNILFGWINIPSFPPELANTLYSFFDLVFDNLCLLGFFVRLSTLSIIIPIFLIAFNFRFLYKIFMWLVGKLLIGLKLLGIMK